MNTTKEQTFSPGEWRAEPYLGGGALLIRGEVCRHPQPSLQIVPIDEAYVMAAAPRLLAALKGLLAARDSTTMGHERELLAEWVPKARAAVAAAEWS